VACGTHGSDDKCIKILWLENLKEKDNSGDLGATRNILLKLIIKYISYEDEDSIRLAKDKTHGGLFLRW
jgi:hypothetical protein